MSERSESISTASETTPLVEVDDVSVVFHVRPQGGGRKAALRAVNHASFEIARGETLALVGESGSGKSTAARAVLRLVPVTSGSVRFDGIEVTRLTTRELRRMRGRMQMVFQDPYSSLDPSSIVANIVGEPLRVHQKVRGKERDRRVRELLEQVGLSPRHLARYTYEFSGGQRQRIAIARAIALNPDLLVLDEAVSALDVSTQNQVLELLETLRRERGLSYLFISHNLGVTRWIADRTAVMYLGNIVESGPTTRVHGRPAHPYTRSLLSAMPVMDPVVQRHRPRIVLQGDPPDPLVDISGCAFRTRCPQALPVCAAQRPEPVPVEGGGWAACHLLTPAPAGSAPVADAAVQPAR
ncbi:MAG: ABC transporter ATP-binding protein [Ilumatobacteraceae bacterium]